MKEQIKNYIEGKLKDKALKKGEGVEGDAALDIAGWLDFNVKHASKVAIATHVAKYFHGDVKATNIRIKNGGIVTDSDECYVSTQSINVVIEDIALQDAKYFPIVDLLWLKVNGVAFWEMIERDDSSALEAFTDSKERLSSWMGFFKTALFDSRLQSHTLAKQVYFPVGNGSYHLLSPLYASSLAQALYERVKNAGFSEQAKSARECRKNQLYSSQGIEDIPELAVQFFGRTKPQNISKLNSERRGKSYLLRSVPPIWKKIPAPPMHSKAFWQELDRKIYKDVQNLRTFLVHFQKRKNNFDARKDRETDINRIIDSLLSLAKEIQQFPSGWSKDSKISESEKIWLDPEREDYQALQTLDEWKEAIAKSFACWLTAKLNSRQEAFVLADVEIAEIENACLQAIKEVTK